MLKKHRLVLIQEKKITTSEENTIKKNDVQNKSENVFVNAIAVLDNCPNNLVTRNNLDSLSQIIDNKDHLQRNNEIFKFGNISNWEFGNGRYKHKIQVIIQVKTAQLWESARSYLWKHLGTSTWIL